MLRRRGSRLAAAGPFSVHELMAGKQGSPTDASAKVDRNRCPHQHRRQLPATASHCNALLLILGDASSPACSIDGRPDAALR